MKVNRTISIDLEIVTALKEKKIALSPTINLLLVNYLELDKPDENESLADLEAEYNRTLGKQAMLQELMAKKKKDFEEENKGWVHFR